MSRTVTQLTPKELHFCAEWLIDKNAKRAAISAGYAPKNAGKTGFELLQRPRVQAEIRKALKEQQARTLIKADEVLKEIYAIAKKAEAKGKYSDALKGLELIGKHYKLFTEKHEHGGIGGGALVMYVTTQDENL